MSEFRDWRFAVSCETRFDEVVCVTGSVQKIGKWKRNDVFPLSKADGDNDVWSGRVALPDGVNIQYRYCVCLFVPKPKDKFEDDDDEDVPPRVVVRRWETALLPRRIGCHDRCDVSVIHDFGLLNNNDAASSAIQTGWLGTDTLLELRLYEDALQIWKKKHADKELFLKVTAIDVELANQGRSMSLDIGDDVSVDIAETRDKQKSWPIVNVAVSNS